MEFKNMARKKSSRRRVDSDQFNEDGWASDFESEDDFDIEILAGPRISSQVNSRAKVEALMERRRLNAMLADWDDEPRPSRTRTRKVKRVRLRGKRPLAENLAGDSLPLQD